MNIAQYPIISDNSHLFYKFESIGPKGIIKKFVQYQKLDILNENTYNLSFGDWDDLNNNIDDEVVSNNDDTEKVLYTVARTSLQFANHFPDVYILIVGSTKSRTRLYQMAIGRNSLEIENLFDLQGLRNGAWEKFKPGINFEAFLIKRKIKNL